MRQPKRSDDKYWTGTRIFHEEQFISDLQDHIDLLNERIEALSIANVVLNEAESEVEFYCDGQENNKDRCESQCLGCAGMQEIYSQ